MVKKYVKENMKSFCLAKLKNPAGLISVKPNITNTYSLSPADDQGLIPVELA